MDGFWDLMVSLTGEVSNVMYTYLLVFLLIGTGLYFTVRTRGVQFRYLKDMFTVLTEQKHVAGNQSVSSFQALMVSTASRVGTGNIAGIATAIATGGPGAVFWMWLMALIGSASAFIESTLAQIFKVHGEDGSFRGGPAYYIQQGLGKRWLGIVFAISLIVCFAFGFNALQSYNAASALEYYVPGYQETGIPMVIGFILVIATAFVIFGGAHRISFMSSIIVPAMAMCYIVLALFVMVTHLPDLPAVFALIFDSAFNAQSIFGGFAGSVVVIGIKRGLFSNEAGMGSAPNAAAAASVSHPCKQGLAQTLSVFLDTLIICTCSSMLVLVFYVNGDPGDLNGMPLVQAAVNSSVGEWGIHFITFSIFCFAYSSLIGNYFYAESNMRFIKDDPKVIIAFRLLCLVAIFMGAQSNFDLAWNIADIVMGVMAFINIVAILLLGKWALRALDDYTRQRQEGKNPVFVADSIEGLPPTECWHESREDLARADARLAETKVYDGLTL